jgi:LmbE family N-acetylglucosaminyl deacetylase/glycosyltransferase involved in cell wall biosynthesis
VPPAVECTENEAWSPAAPALSVLVPFHRDDPRPLLTALDRQVVARPGAVEVVVLDDGSGLPDLAAGVASAVTAMAMPACFVALAANRGRAGARNELVRHARGRHVLFLDADMVPDAPDFLATYLDVVAGDGPAVAFGGFSVEQAPSDPALAVHRHLTSRSDCIPAAERRRDPAKYVFTSNLLVRRDVLETEPFDEGHAGWGWEDVEWGLRVSARWPVEHLDNTATHLGLETVDELVVKYRQSVPNFARLVERHRELVASYPSYRAARLLARVPGLSVWRRALPVAARTAALPVPLRALALRLYRSSLYADAGEPPRSGSRSLVRRARWFVREAALGLWDRRVRPIAPTPGANRPLLVVSTHLDDAVLSCARVLAAHPGSTVLTVMTAQTPALVGDTPWDLACGFRPGDDVMAVRTAEDHRALALVGARPRHLGEIEGQYGVPMPAGVVDDVLAAVAELAPAQVLVPLGIDHVDHRALADAIFARLDEAPGVRWIAYDDLPYREQFPDAHRARLHDLRDRGLRLHPTVLPLDTSSARKLAAVRSYRTQCRPLWRDVRGTLTAEGYWLVTPAEA